MKTTIRHETMIRPYIFFDDYQKILKYAKKTRVKGVRCNFAMVIREITKGLEKK